MVWAKRLVPLLSVVIFAGALLVLHHLLRHIHVAEVARQLASTPPRALLSSLALTAASYLALAGFDGLGATYIGRRLPPARIILISFVSHAVSHSAGFATLTGGAIRYRMYSAVGLTAAEVATVVAFCGITFGLGASSLAALAMLTEPHLLSAVLRLPAGTLRAVGGALTLPAASYLGWAGLSRRPLRLFHHSYPVPPPHIAALQIAVAATDLAFASAALFVLLPATGHSSYPSFVGAYVVANLLGLLAHVPGGLGVFDAAILVLSPGAPAESVLGALLLFRGLYNLLPLALAAVLLLAYEIMERIPGASRRIGGLFDEVGPPVLAVTAFATGAVTVLAHAVPKPGPPAALIAGTVEAAAGCLVMVMARGLNRQSRSARLVSLAALVLMAALVLAQDPFAPRAIALGLLAALLGLSDGRSDHPRSSWPPPLSPPWILAVGAILAGSCGVTWWEAHSPAVDPAALPSALIADAAALSIYGAALVVGAVSFGHRHRRPVAKSAQPKR